MLYLDRMNNQTYFDVFEEVKWHAVEIPSEYEADMLAFRAKAEVYKSWCQEAYLAINGGATPPEFPEELRIDYGSKQPKSRTKES